MCESKVHTCEKPYVSARLARSTTRDAGGVVCSTSPMSIALPRLGEAEVDGTGGGVGPSAGDHLAAGVEVDALGPVHVGVAEQARLPPAEAVVAHRYRYGHVHADHADLHVELELAGGTAVAGEDGRAVGVRVGVDRVDAVLVAVHPHHAEHRPEDLVAVAGRLGGDVVEQRGVEEVAVAGHTVTAVDHHGG